LKKKSLDRKTANPFSCQAFQFFLTTSPRIYCITLEGFFHTTTCCFFFRFLKGGLNLFLWWFCNVKLHFWASGSSQWTSKFYLCTFFPKEFVSGGIIQSQNVLVCQEQFLKNQSGRTLAGAQGEFFPRLEIKFYINYHPRILHLLFQMNNLSLKQNLMKKLKQKKRHSTHVYSCVYKAIQRSELSFSISLATSCVVSVLGAISSDVFLFPKESLVALS